MLWVEKTLLCFIYDNFRKDQAAHNDEKAFFDLGIYTLLAQMPWKCDQSASFILKRSS